MVVARPVGKSGESAGPCQYSRTITRPRNVRWPGRVDADAMFARSVNSSDVGGTAFCVRLLWCDHTDDAQRVSGFAFFMLAGREDHDRGRQFVGAHAAAGVAFDVHVTVACELVAEFWFFAAERFT